MLYAENELSSASLAAVRAQAERLAQHVAIYKVLGGGWVDEADLLAPKPLAFTASTEKTTPAAQSP